jgi:predicted enzyme related to lactoylglutathione lyase
MSIRVEICIDCNDPEALAPFWAAALGYEMGSLGPDGVYLDLVPPERDKPVIYFQRVLDEKTTKNRLHLDLWTHQPEKEISRLESLGSSKVGEPVTSTSGNWWQVMLDPAGNEFCVCRERQ